MENSQKIELTKDVSSLAALNRFNQNYVLYLDAPFNQQAVKKDFLLLEQFNKAYQKRHSVNTHSVGDCLPLPDGQKVYFCHIHDHEGQTCDAGSFHLSNTGYMSYSGGLDAGISFDSILLTADKSALQVWFSHRGLLSGGCAIHANIESRVWITKQGADLSGIPQVKRLRRKLLKAQSETITKTDGNGRPYAEHLPEVVIKKQNLSKGLFHAVQQATGLPFEEDYYYVPVYWCQPIALQQIETLKHFPEFHFRVDFDSITYSPIWVLEVKTQ